MVVGLGSMGKRRIRIVKKINSALDIVGIDAREDRRLEANRLYGINTYAAISDCIEFENPEIAFICASPINHYAVTKTCLEFGLSVFSEINLVNENHRELIQLAKAKGLTLFLSSTPMYRKEMNYVAESLRNYDGKVAYNYHVGQYLPDWHPWENFKDFFVGNPLTNGCREILAIELPWMLEAFGEIVKIEVNSSKISDLEIDFPDTYKVSIQHKNGNFGTFWVDVVARPATRNLQVIGSNFRLDWNGTPDSLFKYLAEDNQLVPVSLYDSVENDSNYNVSIIENMYEEELRCFFDVYKGKSESKHSYEDDIALLKLIDEIEGRK